jgi:hypothetical protein
MGVLPFYHFAILSFCHFDISRQRVIWNPPPPPLPAVAVSTGHILYARVAGAGVGPEQMAEASRGWQRPRVASSRPKQPSWWRPQATGNGPEQLAETPRGWQRPQVAGNGLEQLADPPQEAGEGPERLAECPKQLAIIYIGPNGCR